MRVARRPVLILRGPGRRQGLHQMIWSDSVQLQTRAPTTVHRGWLTCARSHSWLRAELGDACLFSLPGPVIIQLYCPVPVQYHRRYHFTSISLSAMSLITRNLAPLHSIFTCLFTTSIHNLTTIFVHISFYFCL